MAVSVVLSDEILRRLHAAAEPFVETTPEAVIAKLLRFWEGRTDSPCEAPALPDKGGAREVFDARNPPSLTHTKLTASRVDGHPIPSPTWNGVMDSVLSLACERLGGVASLRRIVSVNLTEGVKNDEGFRFVSRGNFSVQGQDANSAWRAIVQVADNLQIPTAVEFEWRARQDAQFPGVAGRMTLEF